MSTSPVDILREFDQLGIRLAVRGSKVHYDAPVGIMTADRLDLLRAVKPHLLQLLEGSVTHGKAAPDRHCARCRDLEARGIPIMRCNECDAEECLGHRNGALENH